MIWKRGAIGRFCVATLVGVSVVAAATAVQAQGYKWPSYFNVVTPNVGTANHSLAVAWTSEFSAATSARVRVLPAPNGFARAQWLDTGEGRVALYQASDYFDQMDGVEGYGSKEAGPHDTRMIHMNMVTPWGFMVRGDSKIKSFKDVGPGTRVAITASSTFLTNGIRSLLDYQNLKDGQVTLVTIGNYGANTKVVTEGRADVTFTSPISGTSFEAEANPNGIRWLPLPEKNENAAAFARYRSRNPGYVPQKTVSGVKSAIGLRMDHAYQANHVRAEEDPEFVYQLAKWLEVNNGKYKDKFKYAYMLSVDSLIAFLEGGALHPLHEGTVRYLKELGRWKPKYQARQDALVKMAEERVAVWQAAVKEAEGKGISIGAGNKDWEEFWTKYRNDRGGMTSYGFRVLELP